MKTQEQMCYTAQNQSAAIYHHFLEVINSDNPLTANDLRKLIEKRPALWSRFANWIPILEARQ